MLESGVGDGEETRLFVGWVMFFRWLLAVKHQGEMYRESLFLVIAGTITQSVVMGLVAGLAALMVSGVSEGFAAGAHFLRQGCPALLVSPVHAFRAAVFAPLQRPKSRAGGTFPRNPPMATPPVVRRPR